MASKRQLQVAELIRRNIGHVMQEQGSYIYGSAFVTVTNVLLTPDMGLAKIYLSVYNADDKDKVLNSIEEHTHPLKQELAKRIRKHVRRIPSISFYLDDILDEMAKVNSLFDNLRTNDQMGEEE